jgi:hypothetical protein
MGGERLRLYPVVDCARCYRQVLLEGADVRAGCSPPSGPGGANTRIAGIARSASPTWTARSRPRRRKSAWRTPSLA